MLQVRGAGAERRIYALCREGYSVARCKAVQALFTWIFAAIFQLVLLI
jgi:hypothetical protein